MRNTVRKQRPHGWGRSTGANPLNAFVEIAQSRELLVALIERGIRLRTKRTMFGVVVPLAAPLAMLLVYDYVFGHVFNTPIRNYPVFVFAGLLPWSFIAQCIGSAPTTIASDSDLVRRAPFPIELLAISSVSVLGLFFASTLAAWTIWLLASATIHLAALAGLLIPTFAVVGLATSIVLLLSIADVYNREIRQVLGNVITLWFFLLPVVYRPRMIPRSMRWTTTVDPMNRIIMAFRDVLYRDQIPPLRDQLTLLAFTVVGLMLSLTIFRKVAANVAKLV